MIILFLGLFCQIKNQLDNKSLNIENVSKPPVIDGRLNDECWKKSAVCSSFTQVTPLSGKPAAVKTIVRIINDSSNLFVSFYCRKLSGVTSSAIVLREDVLGTNDNVMVVLDPFNDKNKGYLFALNPLNVKTEAKISRDGNVINTQWDAYWYSAVSINDTSWTAEIAIPFEVLHFEAGKINEWSANFIRVDYEKLPEPEWSVWNYTGDNPYRVSKSGKLIFKDKLDIMKPINLLPYGSLSNNGKRLGGDINRDFPTLMDIGISIYTDPSYYDVNHTELFINPSSEELSGIPEERRIFVENYDIFSAPYSLVNTRKIDTVKYAYRVSGKAGEYDAAYLSAETQNPKKSYSFLGVSRGFWKGSSISWYDLKADTNRVMSTQVDFSLPNEFMPKIQYSWNIQEKTPSLFYCDISRKTSSFALDLGYRNINSEFINDMGIINETGEDYWLGGSYNLRVNKFVYQVIPSFLYNNNEKIGGVSLVLKNCIGAGIKYIMKEEYKYPVYSIGYNENRASSFRVSYLPDSEKTYFSGQLSFFNKISPDFTVSLLHFTQDSISADFGITGRLNEKFSFRIFIQKPEARDSVSTKAVVKYCYATESYLSLAYGEARISENSGFERVDYVVETKLYHLFRIPVEKLAELRF